MEEEGQGYYSVIWITDRTLKLIRKVKNKPENKDEEEMRLKEEEYMSRRVSAANIARTKVKITQTKFHNFRTLLAYRLSMGEVFLNSISIISALRFPPYLQSEALRL